MSKTASQCGFKTFTGGRPSSPNIERIGLGCGSQKMRGRGFAYVLLFSLRLPDPLLGPLGRDDGVIDDMKKNLSRSKQQVQSLAQASESISKIPTGQCRTNVERRSRRNEPSWQIFGKRVLIDKRLRLREELRRCGHPSFIPCFLADLCI